MIMPRGQQLLLPVNPWFIVVSIFLAFALNMLPLGARVWMPDILLLVLAFWGVHQPQRVGMGLGFLLGLCMDVQHTSLLGQHAMAYSLVMYVAQRASRRLLWFNSLTQALQVLPIFFVAHALQMLVRMAAGGLFPGWGLLIAPLVEAMLWPLACMLLLAPQRRAPDSDSNRPL